MTTISGYDCYFLDCVMVAFIIIGNKFVIHVDDKCCKIGAG